MTLNTTGLGIGLTPSANLTVAGNALINDQMSIGTTSAHSTLQIGGSFGLSIQNLSSNATLNQHSMVMVDTSQGNITLTLPPASDATGRRYRIKKTSELSQLWVEASDNIDRQDSSFELTHPNQSGFSHLDLISHENQWWVLSHSDEATQVMATDNFVAWLKLDESSGTLAYDSSTYNHPTSLDNGLTFSSNSAAGVFKQSLDLEGDNSNKAVMDDADELSPTQELTVSAWIYPTAFSNGQIVRKNNEYLMRLNSNGKILARVFTGGGWSNSLFTNNTYNLSEWNHIAMRWDGSTVEVFVNGELDSVTVNKAAPISPTGNNADIGGWGSFYMDGRLDDFRIYNRALEDNEVIAMAQQGLEL